MARNRCRFIFRLLTLYPCTKPMKLSRYTSTCARAVACACGEKFSQLLLEASVTAAYSDEVYVGVVYTRLYRGGVGMVF